VAAPVLRVLTYHRVLDPAAAAGWNPSPVSATPGGFEAQVRHLARSYRPVSANEVIDALWDGPALPARAVLVTFDDAYRDFGEVAWPILRRHGVPAVLCVPTAYPDHPEREFWWDRLWRAFAGARRPSVRTPLGTLPLGPASLRATARAVQAAVRALPPDEAREWVDRMCDETGYREPPRGHVLGWDELRELDREGVALAAHTRTHPALTRLPPDEARAEIRGSRDDLERETGRAPQVFAYPYGDHDDAVAGLVRDENFAMALTCLDGHNDLAATDPMRLCRTNVTLRTTPLLFRIRLFRLAAYADRWRHRPRNPGGPRAGHSA
jgi:peptidoglycan/xylan/chitin deacetylase (PgdA/CDA1 family)